MYCPDCGHQNPAGNLFCGMCGQKMPERAAGSPNEKRPHTAEMQTEDIARITDRRQRVAEHDPEPVATNLRHREPEDEPVRESDLPAAVAEFYSSRTETTSVDEPTTVSGPSFLGLSGGSGSSSSSSYSYLYEDEQPRSHAGLVFLLFVAILAGAVYWKWQPIRDYVVNAALTHSGQGRPAPAAAPTDAGSPTASSDNAATQPGQTSNPNGLPQSDNATTTTDQPKSDPPKPDDTQPKNAAPATKDTEKTSAPKDQQPQSEVGRTSRFQDVKDKSAADEDASEDSAKPEARRPAQAAGSELVNSGERYLYGRGMPRSCSQALMNFNLAAKQANPRAMAHLGSLYATGQCVPLDRSQAYQWYSRALAVDRGNTYLSHNLTMLWNQMSSGERAKATQKQMF